VVKTYRASQFHAKQIHTLAHMLQMIPPSWTFAVWALDIMGPFPHAIRGYQFLYVAIDKFTKWPEATQWSKSTSNQQYNSSSPSYTDLGSQIGSSWTMSPNLLAVPCKGTVNILASRFAMHLLLIQRAMDRWSMPMQK
jgi:hypothetical protein